MAAGITISFSSHGQYRIKKVWIVSEIGDYAPTMVVDSIVLAIRESNLLLKEILIKKLRFSRLLFKYATQQTRWVCWSCLYFILSSFTQHGGNSILDCIHILWYSNPLLLFESKRAHVGALEALNIHPLWNANEEKKKIRKKNESESILVSWNLLTHYQWAGDHFDYYF